MYLANRDRESSRGFSLLQNKKDDQCACPGCDDSCGQLLHTVATLLQNKKYDKCACAGCDDSYGQCTCTGCDDSCGQLLPTVATILKNKKDDDCTCAGCDDSCGQLFRTGASLLLNKKMMSAHAQDVKTAVDNSSIL